MNRGRQPRARRDTRSPLQKALAEAPPFRERRLLKELGRVGLTAEWLDGVAAGERYAARWLQRLIARELELPVERLFPTVREDRGPFRRVRGAVR